MKYKIYKKEEIQSELIKEKVPNGAFYFEGIVSNWEKNRNWYTIRADAWWFDWWKSVDNFLKNWKILFNHDDAKPIWKPLTFEKVWDEVKVSWYVYDDLFTNWTIERELLTWLSTWHITHNAWYENEIWEFFQEDEFYKLDLEKILNHSWEYIVTEAEIVEFSFVTVPSNRDSTILTEKLEEFAKKINKPTNILLNNFLLFNKKETMTEILKNENEVVETETTENSEVVAEENVEQVEENSEEVEAEATEPVENTEEKAETNEETNKLLKAIEENSAKIKELETKIENLTKENTILKSKNSVWVSENRVSSIDELIKKYK